MVMAILLLMAAPAASAAQPGTTEIVVVARKRKCRVQLGNALLSERELDAYAAQWGKGERVKVHVPSNASYKCLAEIMFKLQDHGVDRAEFIDERTVR